jgi:hypothetical protein
MTKAFKFTFFRKSLYEERFVVEADTLEEAQESLLDGGYPDPAGIEWLSWYDDEFGTDSEFPPEPQCELHKMVKSYQQKETV